MKTLLALARMSPSDAIIAAMKETESAFELGGNMPPSMYISDDVIARMTKDYNLGRKGNNGY